MKKISPHESRQVGKTKTIICPNCDGFGKNEQGENCSDCKGSGKIEARIMPNV